MKKIILLALAIITAQLVRAQVPNWLWAEGASGGTQSYEYMSGMAVDTIANKVFIGGRCGGTNNLGGMTVTSGGAQNPFAGKFDENGNASWLSEYTFSSGYDYPYGFFKDANDNIYLDGTVNNSITSFVEKYNSAGVQQWQVTPGNNNFNTHGVVSDGAGCVYISGWMTNGSVALGSITLTYYGSQSAIIVAKLDATGNYLWAKAFYGTGGNDGECTGRGITIDSHANIYVTGGYTGQPTFGSFTPPFNSGISNSFIVKIDSSGNVKNLITAIGGGYASNDCCTSAAMAIDSCDNIYLTGYFDGTAQFGDYVLASYGGQDGYVAKCDHDFSWDWAQNFGGAGDDAISAITLDKYTDVYIGCNYQDGAAQIEGTNVSGGSMAAVKLDNGKGYVDWVQSCGSANSGDGMGGIAVDNAGYVYVTGSYSNSAVFGTTTLYNGGLQGTNFLAKLDSINHITITPDPDSVYCAGQTYTLPYKVTGVFTSGNIFTAQLSNALGSFANAVNIGTYTSTASGNIIITIPASTPYGNHYRIRVLSTKPTLITTIPTSSCINRPVDTAYFYITIYPIPNLTINGNTVLCPGDTTTLSTSSAEHYLWNNGDTTSSITVEPSSTQQYSVTLTNGPCTWKDSTTVAIEPLPVITVAPANPLICSGGGVSLSASGAVTYKWSPSVGLNAKTGDPVFAGPTVTTTYTVTGTDSNGCVGKTSIAVKVGQTPAALFSFSTPNPCQPQEQQFTNSSTGDSITYTWQFGDGSTSAAINPLHDYKTTGTYKVTLLVTTPSGCDDSLTLTDSVLVLANLALVPNAFTPRAENANGIFRPDVLCNTTTSYLFRVYDRWGEMVFESTNPSDGWNGTYNGKAEPLDVYVYYLKMSCGTCSTFLKGNVTLIR